MSFIKELNMVKSLGYDELLSGCFIANYHDDYMCEFYNGGCKDRHICEQISEQYKKMKEMNK